MGPLYKLTHKTHTTWPLRQLIYTVSQKQTLMLHTATSTHINRFS